MRMNRYETQPNINPRTNLSQICLINISKGKEIASRGDLNESDPTYFGATDVKVTNYVLASEGAFLAQLGPTHDRIKPFEWPRKLFSKLRGLPRRYDFDW